MSLSRDIMIADKKFRAKNFSSIGFISTLKTEWPAPEVIRYLQTVCHESADNIGAVSVPAD